MKARYRMKINGEHVLESQQAFDEAQVADLDRMFEQYGKMMIEELKNHPEWFDPRAVDSMYVQVRIPV